MRYKVGDIVKIKLEIQLKDIRKISQYNNFPSIINNIYYPMDFGTLVNCSGEEGVITKVGTENYEIKIFRDQTIWSITEDCIEREMKVVKIKLRQMKNEI